MNFEEFTQKKVGEYCKLVDFSDNKVYLKQIRNSNLPPYIINFFECSYPEANRIFTKGEFEETLKRAVAFNINYIIRPKQTLLKFLFGIVETKPADYIRERLRYFQFYSYYVTHILDFINLNTPFFVSSSQIEYFIDEINKKILDEISDPADGYTQRLNLIKLLYFFFIDLVENNPINIKLPKKILSAFFQDKGFKEIQKKVDSFFSEEVFIQEAVELIKPGAGKKKVDNSTRGEEHEGDVGKVHEEYSDKAKTGIHPNGTNLIDAELSEKELTIARQTELKKEPAQGEGETFPEPPETDIRTPKQPDIPPGEPLEEKTAIAEEKDTEEQVIAPGTFVESEKELSAEESAAGGKAGIIDTLFCEETYKKRIIKKIFRRDEKRFKETVSLLLDATDWERASALIEESFNKNRIDYFSEEAVKFVDIIQSYFSEKNPHEERIRGNEEYRC